MMPLHALAEAVGLLRHWRDALGRDQTVPDEALAAVLGALGYPADDEAAIHASRDARAEELRRPPPFLSGDVGAPTRLPQALSSTGNAELELESGELRSLQIDGGFLPPIGEAGYHRLRTGNHDVVLAIAPRSCLAPTDLPRFSGRGRAWGPVVQIPSLRGERTKPFGDLGDLREAVGLFAGLGADAVAISPIHALFPGRGDRFSPYSPSSRLFLNAALADPSIAGMHGPSGSDPGPLIDWSTAFPERLTALQRLFNEAGKNSREKVSAWAENEAPGVQRHALFDALSLRFPNPAWQTWPAEYRDPESPTVAVFAREHPEQVELHIFAQWLAAQSLSAVQQGSSEAGMAIGLISDLAVGVDPGGSDAWAMRDSVLNGLSVGAPPDALGPDGQSWGLTSFSPQGLVATAFAPWIATVRAALRHAGGVRIDHAFGLARLWVIPAGAPASEGAYLTYPLADLLRILALESHRAGAIVVGEDLGTRPEGFSEPITEKGILGMRVLWFERNDAGQFVRPDEYARAAVAMTGTHDTATIAGWWRGRDIEWNRQLKRGPGWEAEEQARTEERSRLWAAVGDGSPEPAPDDPSPVVEAAIHYIGKARSELSLLPLEDLLALEEQPNLPGTIDEHPNWRRRLPAPLAELLAEPATAHRIATLVRGRST